MKTEQEQIRLRKEIKDIEEYLTTFKITFEDNTFCFINKSIFNELRKEVLK